MVFCNELQKKVDHTGLQCHNPYFNRWFSAIEKELGEADEW